MGDLVPMHYDEVRGGNFSTEARYDAVDIVDNVRICVLRSDMLAIPANDLCRVHLLRWRTYLSLGC